MHLGGGIVHPHPRIDEPSRDRERATVKEGRDLLSSSSPSRDSFKTNQRCNRNRRAAPCNRNRRAAPCNRPRRSSSPACWIADGGNFRFTCFESIFSDLNQITCCDSCYNLLIHVTMLHRLNQTRKQDRRQVFDFDSNGLVPILQVCVLNYLHGFAG
ncbi:hypothetical protein LXL04_017614 [Taraxacum kok-saghyz]